MLLGLPALGTADFLLVLVNLLSTLGSLGLVVSPGDLGTVGVVELEIRGQLAGRGLVPSSGRTALVYELERVGIKGMDQKGMKQLRYKRGIELTGWKESMKRVTAIDFSPLYHLLYYRNEG